MNENPNSTAITVLCSRLCVGKEVKPLQPKEWGTLAQKLMRAEMQPSDLLEMSKEDLIRKLSLGEEEAGRLVNLVNRSGSLSFELGEYEKIGIHIVTRADPDYPSLLKRRLHNLCPPLFYYTGNIDILKKRTVGYVGSRKIGQEDEDFTRMTVRKTLGQGYGVVSGGAKGVDSIALEEACYSGGWGIAYLSDSMMGKIKDPMVLDAVQRGSLLLLSEVHPRARFLVGTAMARNKYIYAQSSATLVVRSEKEKGGTWSGATENLKKRYCPTLCRCMEEYEGNMALIGLGALPVDDTWNGDIQGMVAEEESRQDDHPVQGTFLL